MSDPVVITKLEVSNFKRLKAVRIEPATGDHVVLITGDNAQGKSAVLDAIASGFGGPKVQGELAPEVIRTGQTQAQVLLELSNGVSLEREWSKGEDGKVRMHLVLRAKDGASYPSPQARIDEAIGRLTFDPMTFMRLDGKKQAEAVRQLGGLDFAEHDRLRQSYFEKRTTVNRRVDELAAQLKGMPPRSGSKRVAVDDLAAKLQKLMGEALAVQNLSDKLDDASERVEDQGRLVDAAKGRIAELNRQLQNAEVELKEARAKLDTLKRNVIDAQEAVDNAPIIGPDIEDVREQLRLAEATNLAVTKDEHREELQGQLDRWKAESQKFSEQIEKMDKDKTTAIAEAKLPVSGLGFNADGVLLNELPLEQASAAQKLRVSVAMGLALNPKIRVLLIRDGSLLDANSMKLVAEMAAEAKAQVWLEVVPKGDVGWIIEDGEVVAVDGKPEGKKKRGLRAVD